MSLKDFKTYFEQTAICKIKDSYATQSIKITPKEDGNWVKFVIDSKGDGFVSVI